MFHFNSSSKVLSTLKKRSGQTIIEATVALALIVVVLSAITITVITSLNNSQFIKSQTLASKYGQEGMEYIRFLSNNDPAELNSLSLTSTEYCYNLPGGESAVFDTTSCPGSPNIVGTFSRSIKFERLNAICSGGTRVTIRVAWSSGKCPSTNRFCHDTRAYLLFS